MKTRSNEGAPLILGHMFRTAVLLTPAILLLMGVTRTTGPARTMLTLGASFQVIVCLLAFLSINSWRQPVAPSVVALYLIALCWLWIGAGNIDDWYQHFAQAILLIVPLTVFAFQTLTNSGAPTVRRARVLAERLSRRHEWPADLAAIRNLPEVKAFRESLHIDATPALTLLGDARIAVRVAALAALEFRKNWRRGQAELVLEVAQRSPEPTVRTAAMSTLANIDERSLVEALADFLLDSCSDVRRAATEALLWDSERRWAWIRHAVRCTLADPGHQADGALQHNGELFSGETVADLHAWASEKGVLGIRAAQTLGVHYTRILQEQPDGDLIEELKERLSEPHEPPLLRLELAQVLRNCGEWDATLQEKLLDCANPALLRLQAAESLLAAGPHPRAVATLYDVARLPNREIALATAEVVQRCLNADVGLPHGQPLPQVQSRQAAEVTRRLMLWANQHLQQQVSGVLATT